MTGINFPVAVADIPKFEQQNGMYNEYSTDIFRAIFQGGQYFKRQYFKDNILRTIFQATIFQGQTYYRVDNAL